MAEAVRRHEWFAGSSSSSELSYAPVFQSLPPLLVDRTGDDKVSAVITSTVREILLLADAATPGAELMLGRLMELLFVEVLRRHASQQPDAARGWFAALNDPIVGRTLQLIHGDPARRWTVGDLAKEAGTSRSVLFERFIAIVGQPPIEYLASWRMQLAAKRLRNTHDNLAAVAADVGYEFGGIIQSRVQAHHRPCAWPLARGGNCTSAAARAESGQRRRIDPVQGNRHANSFASASRSCRSRSVAGRSIRRIGRDSLPSVPCPSCRARPRR